MQLSQLDHNSSLPPPHPRKHPSQHSHPDTPQTPNGPEAVAPPPKAPSSVTTITILYGTLIELRIEHTPHRSPDSRKHSNDPPIRGKVLNAPDDVDNDGDKGESAPIPDPDECGGDVEELGVVQGQRGGEEEEAEREEDGGGEEE